MVSIIIPTFNRQKSLIRACSSVLTQTYDNWELLIVDDGSTDDTETTVNQWIQVNRLENRVRFLRLSQNRGVSAARNFAAKFARGQFLAFLDSDDEWLPDRLARQIPLTQTCRWVHGEEIWIRNGVRVNPMKKHAKSGGRIFLRCVDLCCVSPSAVLMETELFFEHKGFRENFPVCEDFDLWLRLAARHEIGFIPQPIICKYGGHDDQLSRRYKAMDYYRVKALIELVDHPHLSESEKKYLRANVLHRCDILLKGYQKHAQKEHVLEVEQWRALAKDSIL